MQSVRIFKKRFLIFRGVLLYSDSGLRGVADDLVIHVRDVHHVVQFVTALPQISAQKVHCDKRPKIPNVPVVVDRGPAGVHADFVVIDRLKRLDFC